jgi:hypothetical protein
MHVENPFFGFKRPSQIPESYLSAIISFSPDDRSYLAHVRRVADMIGSSSEEDVFTETDLCVFATLLREIAARPSTRSPIIIGMYEETETTTTVSAVWARNPGLQTGFMADFRELRRPKAEPVRRIFAEFTVRMPHAGLVRRMRAYARAMGHDWTFVRGDPYMIVKSTPGERLC